MKTWLCRAAITAVIAVTGTLTMPAAHAARLTIDDAAGDVLAGSLAGERPKPLGETRENVDLLKTSVLHGPRLIRATLKYADLRRNDLHDVRMAALVMRTSANRRYEVFAMHSDLRRRPWVMYVDSRRFEAKCPGLDYSVDFAADTASFEIPRSCVGRPRWIQVVPVAYAMTSDDERTYFDVAGTDRAALRAWSKRVRRG